MIYPSKLSTPHDFVIAQISDLHLSKHHPAYLEQFLAVLHLALNHQPNLLLLTGDLVNDGDKDGYDWLFNTLKSTNTPFLCLAGNHDVTHEIGHDLPFDKRQFLPIPLDARLIDKHRLIINTAGTTWQLLAVNSAVNAQIYGHLTNETLGFLQHHLCNNLPTLITLHHHPIPVGSAWIDEYLLKNHDEFWHTLAHAPRPPHIICGHVHQAHTLQEQYGTLYTCPAASRQFMPHQDDFGLDTLSAGFRLIHLNNTNLNSRIVRLS